MRYIADQNQVGFFYESGTYANASGTLQWIGEVTNHTIDDNLNIIQNRYVGTGTRNIDQFIDGPQDVTGTINYQPQDWKFLNFVLGSNVDAGSPSPYTHTISEVNSASGNAFTSGVNNPFISFGIEDSHKGAEAGLNFVRTIKGAMVDSMTVNMSQGEIVTVDLNYIGQQIAYSSGAATAITPAATRPFLWRDCTLHIPSGTTIGNVTSMSLSISNNLEPPHYLDGNRYIGVPIPQNRDYEFTVEVDGNSETTKTFYDQYFLGGSTFNMMLAINASTGSRDAYIVFSGCKMMDMEAPTTNEGVNKQTLTIMPQSASALVNDAIQRYNPW